MRDSKFSYLLNMCVLLCFVSVFASLCVGLCFVCMHDTCERGQRNVVSPSTVWDLGFIQFVRLSSNQVTC